MRNKKARALRKQAGYKVGQDKTLKLYNFTQKGSIFVTNPEYCLYKELKRKS